MDVPMGADALSGKAYRLWMAAHAQMPDLRLVALAPVPLARRRWPPRVLAVPPITQTELTGDSGSIPGAADPAGRRQVSLQGVQGGDTAQLGGVPAAGRRQGTGGNRRAYRGRRRRPRKKGLGAARGSDRQGHDRGPPVGGEGGEGTSQEEASEKGAAQLWDTGGRAKAATANASRPLGELAMGSTPLPRPLGAQIESPRDSSPTESKGHVHVAEIPGNPDIMSRPSHRFKSK